MNNFNSIFSHSVSNNQNWEKNYNVYQRDDKKYKRIICIWNQCTGNTNQLIKHEYHACINTETGDIYLDCRRRKIFMKHLALSIVRPLHTCMKTAWHIGNLFFLLGRGFIKIVRREKEWNGLAEEISSNIKDIFKTPFYGVIMTLTHIMGILAGCISPNTLYVTREWGGFFERKLLGVERITDSKSFFLLNPCFSPAIHLIPKNLSDNGNEYNLSQKIKSRLRLFAEQQLSFRMNNTSIFNDCMHLLPKNKPYISSAALAAGSIPT